MIARRLLVSGHVQGVFFRAWTERNARALGISGWVRNLASGEVEVLASGSGQAVEELIRRCWIGPPAASVDAVNVEEAQPPQEQGFRQIRTA